MSNKKGPKVDLTGRRFGFLEVIRMEPNPNDKRREYKAVCLCHNCGGQVSIFPYHLRKGMSRSCGCDRSWYKRGKYNYNYTGYEDLTGTFWDRCKGGALGRNLEFSISIEYAWKIFVKQNKRCALTGVPICLSNEKGHRATASLDRINNNLGYIEGNVHWVHRNINIMKYSLDFPYFINMCRRISNNPKFKDIPDMTDEQCLSHKLSMDGTKIKR